MEIGNVNIIVAFLAGTLSFLSPCVLPLLPGYLSMMSGYSATDLAEGRVTTGRMFRTTLLFVAGFTVVFVALGATATALGSVLIRNQRTLLVIAGWVVIGMGALITASALWNPRLLMPFMRERRVEVRPSRLGRWAAPVMGAAFGFGWTPCIGPILGSIFTIAATEGSVTQGMLLLFVYSMGLGVPFVLAGVGIRKAYGTLDWFKRHFKAITVMSGLLLVGFGVLMVTNTLLELNIWFQRILPDWLEGL